MSRISVDSVAVDQARAAWSSARAAWASVEVTRLGVLANAAVVVVALGAAVWPPIAALLARRAAREAFAKAMKYADQRMAAAASLFYGDIPDGVTIYAAFRDVRATRRMISALARREHHYLRLKSLLQMRDVLGRAARTLKEASNDSDRRQAMGDVGWWNGEYSTVVQESRALVDSLPSVCLRQFGVRRRRPMRSTARRRQAPDRATPGWWSGSGGCWRGPAGPHRGCAGR